MKYFIIGFNKCGTSTFHKIFIENGITNTDLYKKIINVVDQYMKYENS